ncbi:hypothetical protein FA95DRAFT_1599142 [Auriscalpium vulgare]|uniref:Uncharacterized protein n=1 Tax=Auriscalpium vulgare TaxID=40419 RepID=A0ACB8RAK7_9AGAM|nr:hypothetical protein FA95DRAFT_1599142 [Auriscalpium vulgare]
MSTTLAINIFCTSMIVLQIWLTQRRSTLVFGRNGVIRGRSFNRAIGIIVESASMYTVTAIVFFALELTKSNAEYTVAECIVQIIGIAFNLIIIRVERGQSIETQAATSTAIHIPRADALQPRGRSSSGLSDSLGRTGTSIGTPLPMHTAVLLQPLGMGRQGSVESFGKERFKSNDVVDIKSVDSQAWRWGNLPSDSLDI